MVIKALPVDRMNHSAAPFPELIFLMVLLLFVSLLGLQGALALSTFARESRQESSAVAYVDPRLGGGSLIDISSSELKEPLNVNISPHCFSRTPALTTYYFSVFGKKKGYYIWLELAWGPDA